MFSEHYIQDDWINQLKKEQKSDQISHLLQSKNPFNLDLKSLYSFSLNVDNQIDTWDKPIQFYLLYNNKVSTALLNKLMNDYPNEFENYILNNEIYQIKSNTKLDINVKCIDIKTDLKALKNKFSETIIQVKLSNDFYLNCATIMAINQLYPDKEICCKIDTSDIDISENKLIAASSQALAAVLSGTHQLVICPITGINDDIEFSYRMAINIYMLLKYESKLDQIGNRLKGAPYFENYSQLIIQNIINA